MSYRVLSSVLACLAAITTACVPGAQGPGREDRAAAGSSGPKVLRVGLTEPPLEGGIAFGGAGTGRSELIYTVHAALTVYDDRGELQPWIAAHLPTVENGDWQVLPDGRMELTWRLRPNVLWHDGTPLAAEDFALGYRIARDQEMFATGSRTLRMIDEMAAPDPQTLIVRWRDIYIFGNAMGLNTLIPLPRHILGAPYEAGNKQAVANSLFWTSEWVGLGPYRVSQWMDGSLIDTVAFDQYFLGRPKIDRITIRYIFDVNALVLNLIAGDIDVAPVGPFKEEEGYSLRTQWESRGAGTVMINRTDLRTGRLSWRYPGVPWVQDVRVRQALLHMLDRQTMVDTLRHGLSEVADIALPKEDAAYQLAHQRDLPSYPYDLGRAHRLLAESGLARGPDGVYRTQGGEPFSMEVGATSDTQTGVQEALSIVDQWKTAGLDVSPLLISDTDLNKQEIRSKVRGIYMGPGSLGYGTYQNFITREITSEATRWTGANRGAYSNPAYDQLVDRVYGTIRSSERAQAAADLARMALEQLPFLPLYYVNDVAAFRKGMTGLTPISSSRPVNAWNVHLWDIE